MMCKVLALSRRSSTPSSRRVSHIAACVYTCFDLAEPLPRLQEAFKVPLVVQLTDDEKFLFKPDLKLEEVKRAKRSFPLFRLSNGGVVRRDPQKMVVCVWLCVTDVSTLVVGGGLVDLSPFPFGAWTGGVP